MTEERRVLWTTEKVKESKKKLDEGFIIPGYKNPFFEKTPGLKKANISFSYTDMEIDEYTKCKIDIRYFANNYCFIKTEDGSFKVMTLRDYQYDILDLYDDNKFSILMASRQVGKCIVYNTSLVIYNKKTKNYKNMKFFQFLFKIKKKKNIYDYLKYILYTLISILS